MSIKLTANSSNPPIGGLATAHLISDTIPVEIIWGNETLLEFPDKRRLLCHSNNDVLRALARAAPTYKLYGDTEIERTQIDHWLSFSLTCGDDISWAMSFLDKSIEAVTYLVSNKLTIADFALFNEMHSRYDMLSTKGIPQHVKRWYDQISMQPLIVKVLKTLPVASLTADKRNKRGASNDLKDETTVSPTTMKSTERKQEGKFIDLPGAEMGKVVVRFPPEASGYLHIGHAKAALLNQYYAQNFNGKLIMRFDDTNPAKENVEFENVILGDVEMLQIKPDMFTHTSNYFDLMLQYCEQLIQEGRAYVDDTPGDQMKLEREQRIESVNRSNDVEKNMKMWKEMVNSTEYGQKCCVRAKIDMSSPNGCMRDPTIYRCKNEPHPRTGTKYKVYPTYDFACPIVDSIEGVTHTLRTMEYHDRDDQFYWFIDALKLRKPYIWEYSRLNMTNTVLSKRKLTWFVESGLVDGWDDPRFPTVRGIIRRGMTVEGLKEFIIAQGSSKSVVFMNWDKIWAFNKKVIDPVAPRFTALEYDNRIIVNIDGAKFETIEVPVHPKNESLGKKFVTLGPRVYIDYEDAEALKEGENATFINWGNVLIKKITKGLNGKITGIEAVLNLSSKDFKKTLKLTWLAVEENEQEYPPTFCVYFDNIISKPVLGKDEDFKQYIGHKTREEVKMLGDPELKKCKKGDIIQLQRRGFFKVDNAFAPPSPFSNASSPIILFSIPDGHTKNMPSSGLKISTSVQETNKNNTSSVAATNERDLDQKINEQGDVVRNLKAKKAAKDQIDVEVKKLLALKADYKIATGKDWKPGQAPSVTVGPTKCASDESNASAINASILKQGDLIRDLKAKKVPKTALEPEVQILLDLKAQYKSLTGADWKPNQTTLIGIKSTTASTGSDTNEVNASIIKQGDLVRDLKAKKAPKNEIEAQVKILLDLKAQYKLLSGTDWKPCQTSVTPSTPSLPASSATDADSINAAITKQGDFVRDLKAKKASKEEIEQQVKILLDLKAQFKSFTGKDWKPGQAPKTISGSTSVTSAGSAADANAINTSIVNQGNLVRDLKAKKAPRNEIDPQVQILLDLKAKFKTLTGNEWKPGSTPVVVDLTTETPVASGFVLPKQTVVKKEKHPEQPDESIILNAVRKIESQYNKLCKLKEQNASAENISREASTLSALQVDYKSLTGNDWFPPTKTSKNSSGIEIKMSVSPEKELLTKEINEQGDKVRSAKANKLPAEEVEIEVKKLLSLKAKYKEVTGTDFPTAGRAGSSKKSSEKKSNVAKKEAVPLVDENAGTAGGLKKQTRLGLEATKQDNLPEWYTQVITKGELIEYYDVSGCYILRPWSFAIWKYIKGWFDAEITKMGVKECYFPIFVSRAALEREKTHIADFAPEVAWVTKSGDSDLAEPIAVRPTSETVMYPAYAKWIQSYRDLPIRLNQWNNVVRWEFKHPQPFLRTREFLWQEGHTAFATKAEADKEVLDILDLYAKIYTDILAIPVVKGRKTEKEQFAGSDYTTTVEAYISASGRAIQGATSHHLGQRFSKMFEIQYEDPETREKQFVYQNSWGITTRTIGVMVMVHGDNRGLVLPPHVACIQAIIVPCGITVSTKEEERVQLLQVCKNLELQLNAKGIRSEGDYRDNYSPGWKFNHWELKGVPLRIEIGPKDMKANQIVTVRRDTGEKLILAMEDVEEKIYELLETVHDSMLAKAKADMVKHTKVTKNWSDFCEFLDMKNIILSPFCGEIVCEDKIKVDSAREEEAEPGALAVGAKTLCIPFEQPASITSIDRCINPHCSNKPKYYTLFGRSY